MIDPVNVERLADVAWPAAECVPLGPWRLRANRGVTRRTNSVFTAGHDDARGADLEHLVDAAERFYAARSLPPVFQISAATGARELDGFLARRGYVIDGASEVWTAEVGNVERPGLCGGVATRADEPGGAWFDTAFAEDGAERRRVHEEIVRRSPRPRVFVSVVVDGRVAACAMGVGGGGLTGLFCMATGPEFRRRGFARALLGEVAGWAAGQGGAGVYLQVMAENEGGRRLYRQAGFEPAYDYHYRTKA